MRIKRLTPIDWYIVSKNYAKIIEIKENIYSMGIYINIAFLS